MNRREFTKVAASGVAAAAVGKVALDRIETPQPAEATPVAPAAEDAPPAAAAVDPSMFTPRPVQRVVVSQRKLEGAGFPVRRPFPTATMRNFDPFVLVDEMGPIDWAPGKALGAPDHPHRGFETVSYILEGGVEHADSMGNRGKLGAGDVQWMTAGRGIVHSEEPPAAMRERGGRMHGFQIWVNLPRRLKMTEPRYQEVVATNFPEARTPDGKARVRVIAGEALGVRARIDVHTPIVYQHWIVEPGGQVLQPVGADHNAGLYVFVGGGRAGAPEQAVREGDFAVFGAGDAVAFSVPADAPAPMQALLLAGVPHGDPIVQWGPFVMNSMDEIHEAFADYRAGKMGRIPQRAG